MPQDFYATSFLPILSDMEIFFLDRVPNERGHQGEATAEENTIS